MKRIAVALAFLFPAACAEEPENIQEKAANLSRALEEKANQIEAEAENAVAAQTAPLDNEAEALLNRFAPAGEEPAETDAQ